MPFVIDLSKEISKERFEKARDLVVQAIANDARFAPAQRMAIIREVTDTLSKAAPKTYEELIAALDESLPRKKGYIPDAKRFVVELLAKDAGVALDPGTTRVKYKGNIYSLFNEPGQRTLRSGFIDKASAADEAMTPLSNAMKGVQAEPLKPLSAAEAEALQRADEDLAERIAKELEKRGKRVVTVVSEAPQAARTQIPQPAQVLNLPKTPEAELAERILRRIGQIPQAAAQTPATPAAPATPSTLTQIPGSPPKPPVGAVPVPEPPAPPVVEPPKSRIIVEEVKIAPQEAPKIEPKTGISVTKDRIESVLKTLGRDRRVISSRVERIAEEVLKKLKR